MPIGLVGSPVVGTTKFNVTSGDESYAATPASGELLVAIASVSLWASGITIASGGNAWTERVVEAQSGARVGIFTRVAGAAEATLVTASRVGSNNENITLDLLRVSGQDASPIGVSNRSIATAVTKLRTGVVTPAQPANIIVTGHGLTGLPGGTRSFSDSFTGTTGDRRLASAYRIVSATGDYSTEFAWTGGTARDAASVALVIKEAAGTPVQDSLKAHVRVAGAWQEITAPNQFVRVNGVWVAQG